MKDFENKIKDRLNNAVSNEGIDANDLWESISSEIGSSPTPAVKSPSSKFNLKKFWPLLALLLLIGLGFYYFQFSKNSSLAVNKNVAENAIDNSVKNKNAQLENSTAANSIITEKKAITKNSTSDSDHSTNFIDKNATLPPNTSAIDPEKDDNKDNLTKTKSSELNDKKYIAPRQVEIKTELPSTKNSTSDSDHSTSIIDKNTALPPNTSAIDPENDVNKDIPIKTENSELNDQKYNTASQEEIKVDLPSTIIPENSVLDSRETETANKKIPPYLEANEKKKIQEQQQQSKLNSILITDSKNDNPVLDKEQAKNETAQLKFDRLDLLNSKSISWPLTQREKQEIRFDQIENLLDRKIAHISIGLYGGSHILKNRFTSTANDSIAEGRKDLLNAAYKVQFGQQAGLEINYHLNKKLFLSGGLEYQRSIVQFDLVQEWATTTEHPTQPGALIDARAVRTIQHHNEFTTLSLPISVGYQRELGRWGLGASAGVAFNFARSQTGKALNANDQISVYPSSDNPAVPISNFFMSYQLRPYIYFKSSPKIAWHLRTDFRYQQYGESDYYGLKHSGFLTGLNFGVAYKL